MGVKTKNTTKGNERNDRGIKVEKERRERKREVYRTGERGREQMRNDEWRARQRKVERQSQHLSWKLMGSVTSYGVESEGGSE